MSSGTAMRSSRPCSPPSKGAEHTIDFLTFVYWRGKVGSDLAALLSERARAGVRVRVLLDSWGARPIDPNLVADLERAGVHVCFFRPLKRLHLGEVNHRTHRKVLIVDEAIGFTGGVGISDNWLGDARDENEWRDTHFRVTGPAVDGLRAAFLDNWAESDPVLFEDGVDRFPTQPKPGAAVVQCVRGASETGWSDVATLYRTLLQLAETEIRITTAYFAPDADLSERMCAAADRGVHVHLLLPGPHADKRFVQLAGEADYGRASRARHRHLALPTVDAAREDHDRRRDAANVGSANLNARSVTWDEEIDLVTLEPCLVRTWTRNSRDLDRSVRIRPGQWEGRSIAQRALEKVVVPARRSF